MVVTIPPNIPIAELMGMLKGKTAIVSARINLTQIPILFLTENPSGFAKIPRYYQLSIYPHNFTERQQCGHTHPNAAAKENGS
jgi:hypothetical protein